ncbi:MAG: glycoside hydrolase domain-containing protein [Planctomycetota bacterium]
MRKVAARILALLLVSGVAVSAEKDDWAVVARWEFNGKGLDKLTSVPGKLAWGRAQADLDQDGVVRFEGQANQCLIMDAPARGWGECADVSWAMHIAFRLPLEAKETEVVANFYEMPNVPPNYGRRLLIRSTAGGIQVYSYLADGSPLGEGRFPKSADGRYALTVAWEADGPAGVWKLYSGEGFPEEGLLASASGAASDPSDKKIVLRIASNSAGNQPLHGEIDRIVFYRKAGGPAPRKPATEGWELRFEDSFNRAQLGDDWKVLDGEWRIEDGKLVGRGMILCTRKLPGSQRMTYDARSDTDAPCDLSAFLSAGEKGLAEGAFFGFGSNLNTLSKLVLARKQVAQSDALIERGKWHSVACEREGLSLRQAIDGRASIEHVNGGTPELREGREGGIFVRDVVPLSGDGHALVGLYAYTAGAFDNVRVYTKADEAAAVAPPEEPANLVANGGFETLERGTRDQPAEWVELRWSRRDSVSVVTDPTEAHGGRRYLRLCAPEEQAIQIHNIPSDGIRLEPGKAYDVRVWARAEDGAEATLTVEPGHGRAELTPEWKEYRFAYEHPKSAKPELGFFVAVHGGPALVDDASLVPDGRSWESPAEWRADRAGLADAGGDPAWNAPTKGGPWKVRVPITFTEVMGETATDYVAALHLGDVYPACGYAFLSFERLAVVDDATGEALLWTVVNADRDDTFSEGDYLVFRVSVPARTRKTVYVYLADPRDRAERTRLSSVAPVAFSNPSGYRWRLYCDVGRAECPVDATCRVRDGRLEAEVWERVGRGFSAKIVSPSGKIERALGMARDSDKGDHWSVVQEASSVLTEDGVWEMRIETQGEGGDKEEIRVPFVSGSCLWGTGNVRKVNRSVPPLYREGRTLRVAAARNERESFQVAIEGAEDLGGITLSVTDLSDDEGAKISAENARIERVEEIFLSKPRVGAPAGWYADPILPWRPVDLGADERRVAWITISVPGDARAGVYRGEVVARTRDGMTLSLPLELTVFDFALPDRLGFIPVLGADLWVTQSRYPRTPGFTNPDAGDAYSGFDRLAVVEYGRHLARNHCTPFYYFQWTSPYPTPWQYDREARAARFDFSVFDREAEALLAAGAQHLFVGDRINSGWQSVGFIQDWKGNDLRWPTWKSRPFNYRYALDTEEGLAMLRAWGEAFAEHLAEKGWLDETYVYVVDEAKTDDVRTATEKVAGTLRGLSHPLKPFGASYAHTWYPFLERMSALTSTGLASEDCLARFQEKGIAYWGTYNRPNLPDNPLSVPRIIGPHCFFLGVDHYFQWASWHVAYGWLNAHMYTFSAENAGYPASTFVDGIYWPYGLGELNYAWPLDEPLPEGKERAFAPSLRFEALRESVEDHEYLKMLSNLASGDSQTAARAKEILVKTDRLIRESAVGPYPGHPEHTTHAVFLVDEAPYQTLRREAGALISEAASSGGL